MNFYVRSVLQIGAILFATFVYAGVVSDVYAEKICVPVYGGGEICEDEPSFTVVKTVDRDSVFIDAVNNTITFTITVTNTGVVEVEELVVKDYLPAELQHIAGDLHTTLYNFGPGQQEVITITTKPKRNLTIANEKCVINEVEIFYNDQSQDRDDASVCLKKGKVLAEELPETSFGYELIGMASGLSIAFGAVLKELVDKKLN